MSDDETDEGLLALLRNALGRGPAKAHSHDTIPVLKDAEFICDNSVDVAIDYRDTKVAAATIWSAMQKRGYSTKTWSMHDLHPKTKNRETVNFIFTMDLLNYCFWSESISEPAFEVEYRGQRWTGYWGLVAALQRALDEGTPSPPRFE